MVKLREKKISGGRVSFYLDIYSEASKERTYKFLRLHAPERKRNRELYDLARKDAERIRLSVESDAALNRFGVPNDRKLATNANEYFKQWSAGKSGSYQGAQKLFERFAGGDVSFEAIDPMFCERFQTWLLTQVKSATASVRYAHFKTMLGAAFREGIIRELPTKRATNLIKIKSASLPALTFEELQSLERTACTNGEVRRAFLFMCVTGLRISDVKALRWADIDGDVMRIRVKKTGASIVLPLIPAALALLDEQRGVSGGFECVFVIPAMTTFLRVLNVWAKDAGISKHLGAHTARRSFATLAAQGGADILTLQRLLGHSTMSMSARYIKENVGDMRRAAMVLQPKQILMQS